MNASRPVESGSLWNVTTIDRPGNYTFTVATESWSDPKSVRLPRATGDRESYVEVADVRGEYPVRVRREQ